MNRHDVLVAGLQALEIKADERAVKNLIEYTALIERWSKAYNLVAQGDVEKLVSRHLLDCASVLPYVSGSRLLDAGSGAGLPGVPMAILNPGLHCTLLDSAGKKIRFLNHVKRTLGLANITPVHARLEQWEPSVAPDTVISRAFKSLLDFGAAVRHLVAPETRLLAMKGRLPEEELADLPYWLELREVKKIVVPELHAERHLVIMSCSAA